MTLRNISQSPTKSKQTSTINAARIELLDFQLVDERYVRGRCRLRIDDTIIGDVKVVCPALGQPFVALPQRKAGDDWIPIVSVLSPTLQAEIDELVLNTWRNQARGRR